MKPKSKPSEKVKAILSIHILTAKYIKELEYRSGPFVDEFGREGYGTIDCTGSLSIDELLDLRNFIDKKIKERVK